MSASDGPPPVPQRTPWTVPALVDKLQVELRALEALRVRIVAKRQKGYQVLAICAVICIAVAVAGLALLPPVGLAFGLVPLVICWLVVHSKYFGSEREFYENEYKRRIIGGMTKALEPGMSYHPQRGLSESLFRSSGLYNGDIDRYSCEDLFEGMIGKTSLWLSEVHAEDKRRRTDSKGRSQTYWVTIFKGLFVVADFHKHFRSEVVIVPDFAEATFGWLGRAFQKLGGNLEQMENPEFEKAFVVRATDPVECRYVLTPDMQERLLAFRSRMGKDVRFAFRDSHVYITVPNSADWFEPNLSHPAHDHAQMELFLAQMASCFHLVEALNLNTRIWTKR